MYHIENHIEDFYNKIFSYANGDMLTQYPMGYHMGSSSKKIYQTKVL